MLTYFQGEHDKSECHKSAEDDIKFVVARSDAAEILEVMEQSLDLVAPPVERLVIFPWLLCIAFWRYDRDTTFSSDGTTRD